MLWFNHSDIQIPNDDGSRWVTLMLWRKFEMKGQHKSDTEKGIT